MRITGNCRRICISQKWLICFYLFFEGKNTQTYGSSRFILKNLEFVDRSDEQLIIRYGKGCKYDFEGHKLCNAIWPTIVDFIFSYNLLTYLLTLRLVMYLHYCSVAVKKYILNKTRKPSFFPMYYCAILRSYDSTINSNSTPIEMPKLWFHWLKNVLNTVVLWCDRKKINGLGFGSVDKCKRDISWQIARNIKHFFVKVMP